MEHWGRFVFLAVIIMIITEFSSSSGANFTDPCKAETRPCFQSYIDSGEIPEAALSDEFVMSFLTSAAACTTKVDLAECVLDSMSNCSNDFMFFTDEEVGITFYVGDIVRELLCEVSNNAECEAANDCQHETWEPVFHFPSGGYALYSVVGFVQILCEAQCLAPILIHCPASSIAYARTMVGHLRIRRQGDDVAMLEFANKSCPLIHDLEHQCVIDQMATTGFTECLDLTFEDYPNVMMYLNQIYLPTPEELDMSCKVYEDLKDCIETHVGPECNEQSLQLTVDGLFTLGFTFNMSTCESGTMTGNGAISIAMETKMAAAIWSLFWVLLSCFDCRCKV